MDALRLLVLASVGVAVFGVSYLFARVPAMHAELLGYRGAQRRRVLENSGSFRLLLPLTQRVAGWWAELAATRPFRSSAERLAHAQRQQLTRAGDYLGLTPEEYTALTAISALGFGALGALASQQFDLGPFAATFTALGGGVLPYLQVDAELKRRLKQAHRELPPAMDLAALCVGAGMDFPGALRQVVEDADPKSVIGGEVRRILDALELGHTRREALKAFGQRVPIPPVCDLVRALVQAEEKGTPLGEVLEVQARMGRMQRSIAAEELAARAGVMMILPMVLLLGCILLLLMGPFIVSGGAL